MERKEGQTEHHGEKRFDPSKWAKLESLERRKLLPPDQLLTHLRIGREDVVLDLGAGTGYFTLPAAGLTDNQVIALDVEPQMLDFIKQRLEEQKIQNVRLLQGAIENIPLPEHSVDRIIASFVMHEVEPLSQGNAEIDRILRPGGYVLFLEWEKKPMEMGPPLNHRLGSEELKQALVNIGFRSAEIIQVNENHYGVIAQK